MYDEFQELRRNRPRTRFVGSAGMIAFLAGLALSGQVMIWLGMFKPGVTPNSQIIEYWPGFLFGGALLGFLASFAARIFYDFYCTDD
jgi:hypothetical protein